MQNIQEMMKKAQALQAEMASMQQKLESEEVEGIAGAGMVKITCTCKGEVRKLFIDKSIVNPDDSEMLADLIVAAFNNAKSNADFRSKEEMEKLASKHGLPANLGNMGF
jgi:DNA-binding YbaB/EbfC family protein